jgi:hypothetical protein
VVHFLSLDVKWPCTSCSSRTTDHWGVTPHAEDDAESPGSGGASPYLRLGSRVMGLYPGLIPHHRIGPEASGRIPGTKHRFMALDNLQIVGVWQWRERSGGQRLIPVGHRGNIILQRQIAPIAFLGSPPERLDRDP